MHIWLYNNQKWQYIFSQEIKSYTMRLYFFHLTACTGNMLHHSRHGQIFFLFKLTNMLPLNLIIFSQREISSNVYLETCTSMSGVLITQRVYMICAVFTQIPSISLSSAIFSFVLLLVLLLVHNKILLSTHSFTFIVIKQPIYFSDLFLNPYAIFPRSTL